MPKEEELWKGKCVRMATAPQCVPTGERRPNRTRLSLSFDSLSFGRPHKCPEAEMLLGGYKLQQQRSPLRREGGGQGVEEMGSQMTPGVLQAPLQHLRN